MDYPLSIDGFEGHDLVLRLGNWGGQASLLFDGEPVPPGPRRNQYVLTDDDGNETVVKLRRSMFDPVPVLVAGDQVISLAPPLRWYELVWCFLPLALVFTPGLDGIVLGFAGSWANHQLFRSERSNSQKYLLTAAVTLAAAALWAILSGRLPLK